MIVANPKIKNFSIFSTPLGYLLDWEFRELLNHEIYTLKIKRAVGSPQNYVFEKEFEDLPNYFNDLIYKNEHRVLNNLIYYTLELSKNGKEPELFSTSIFENNDPVISEVRKKRDIQFDFGGSQKGWLFKLKRGGEICSCFNPVTRKTNAIDCPKCYGTGIIGGYIKEEEVSAIFQNPQRLMVKNKRPITMEKSYQIILNCDIPCHEGDILYFLDRNIIMHVLTGEIIAHNNSIIYQRVFGKEVESYDVLRRFIALQFDSYPERKRTYIPFDVGRI